MRPSEAGKPLQQPSTVASEASEASRDPRSLASEASRGTRGFASEASRDPRSLASEASGDTRGFASGALGDPGSLASEASRGTRGFASGALGDPRSLPSEASGDTRVFASDLSGETAFPKKMSLKEEKELSVKSIAKNCRTIGITNFALDFDKVVLGIHSYADKGYCTERFVIVESEEDVRGWFADLEFLKLLIAEFKKSPEIKLHIVSNQKDIIVNQILERAGLKDDFVTEKGADGKVKCIGTILSNEMKRGRQAKVFFIGKNPDELSFVKQAYGGEGNVICVKEGIIPSAGGLTAAAWNCINNEQLFPLAQTATIATSSPAPAPATSTHSSLAAGARSKDTDLGRVG